MRTNLMSKGTPFIGCKGVEIAMAQAFLRAERDARVELFNVVRLLVNRVQCSRACGEGIGETIVALGWRHAVRHLRQQKRAQFAFPIGIAPEQIEGLMKE